MTLKSLITSDVTSVFLNTDEFAERVTRYPCGDRVGGGFSVTGVFEEQEPAKDTSRGQANVRRGTLHVAAGTDVSDNDSYLINSELWQLESWGRTDSAMMALELVRHEEHRRKVRPV